MSAVGIRRIRLGEAEVYREVRLRALADAPLAFGTTYAEAAARPQEWWESRTAVLASSDDAALFIAAAREVRLGLLGVSLEGPGRAEFTSMWVDPAARGTGLGRRLMEAASAWAAERGAGVLELWVTEGNEHATALYAAYGFAFTGGSQPHPSQPGLREWEMRREQPALALGADGEATPTANA